MAFLKDHLIGDNYTWNDDVTYIGSPSRRLFDRFNGYQVLFIINAVAAMSPGFTVEKGQKIELLIQNSLPLDAKSELSVFHWLNEFAVASTNKV